ncbi:MBL fold metallo-hydrolase [Pseudalkalibacillus berkeleyi]|uniref:MBL fold metallo-hydrolase n=1 Tax=Pseudalkalibacillus berkeleyi TaxID=1069813 RepID=A0ABS9GXQ5_9BACL|nr:rhodanese-like domain-containing protein [Pseudalkalibacillus berkeleyi]MCF6137484.1 MBL fold metallo-hydrolase [Pseudalkalibacillus berkeleyi]
MEPLTVNELVKKILDKEEVFLLDVRKQEDYEDWSVEGKSIRSMNIPFSDLKNKVEEVKQQLPEDKTIYVMCAKGVSSKQAVQLLEDAGVENITHVKGGMTAWSEHLEPIKIGETSKGGSLYQFVRIGKGCLSYLIESNGDVAIVDSNRMADVYLDFVKKNNWTIQAVIDTHLHADHISGGYSISKKSNASYWFPPEDDEGLEFEYSALKENQTIQIGDIKIEPIYSPGHTVGSTSLIVDNQFLLTGDILFIESIGRPDLAGKADAWVDDLRNTLYERYEELPQDLIVLPSHFGDMNEMNEDGSVQAKLNDLYKKNERLNIDDAETFNHMVTDNLPPQPNSHEEIRKTNMGQKNPDDDEKQEMEVGPNRCAVS